MMVSLEKKPKVCWQTCSSFHRTVKPVCRKNGPTFSRETVIALTEIFFNVPTTAHILGGSIMGKSSSEGVIDSQNRVFHYKNMYICDGSMIGANLGVNPSLTITALSERAMSHVPSKAENPDFS